MKSIAILGILVSTAGTALAQTTWTSFEDRRGHAIATDGQGGVLMFGGESIRAAGNLLADTDSFTNSGPIAAWSRLLPLESPPPTTEHAMAAGNRLPNQPVYVLFGGAGAGGIATSATYVYDGSGWGIRNLGLAPSARTGHAMVTDRQRNRILLFGGFAGGFSNNELWEFDPALEAWTQLTTQGGTPASRFDHAMAFHPGQGPNDGRTYLFGGTGFRFDIWELDMHTSPPTWTNVTPATHPSGRRRCAMAYLPAFDHIVMFGGQDNTLASLGDTWVWDRYSGTGTWAQALPTPQHPETPPARFNHAFAADQLGNNIVLLGGEDGTGNVLTGTWLWNGAHWSSLSPPAPRQGAAMADDSTRERQVLFGGRTLNPAVDTNETWELVGRSWMRRTPANQPSPRAYAGMAFDKARNQSVLFGGMSGGACGSALGDTWEWNGSNWQQRGSTIAPPAGGGMQMVFDPVRSVVWNPTGAGATMEMWSWNGLQWTPDPIAPLGVGSLAYDAVHDAVVVLTGWQQPNAALHLWRRDSGWALPTVSSGPSPRGGAALAYDSARQRIVFFGGHSGSQLLQDTWTWNGTAWSSIAVHGAWPSPRTAHALVYDSVRQRTVLFGGNQDIVNYLSFNNETWEWDGTDWTQRSPAAAPSPRGNCAFTFDPGRGRTVVVCGETTNYNYLAETWEYDGTTWYNRSGGNHPVARVSASATFDPVTARVILFGGGNTGGVRNDTWAWNGTQWSQLFPANAPSPRLSFGEMTNDGSRTILVGGFLNTPPTMYRDVYEWDGQNWHLRDAGIQPQRRIHYGAAYDSRRDKVVMFGGITGCGGSYLDDTWEWSGGRWEQQTPQQHPTARAYCQISYDTERDRVVLVGGAFGAVEYADTWEWDGTNWSLRNPAQITAATSGHASSFDSAARRVVIVAPTGTWDYGPVTPAATSPYGTGCPGSAGTPSLSPKPWAGPWLGDRFECDLTNRPPGIGIFVWGFSDASWQGLTLPWALTAFGSPNCFLRTSDDIHELLLPGLNTYTSFVLPNHPSFLGAVMFGQAGFFDAGAGGRVVTSNALRMTFGSK